MLSRISKRMRVSGNGGFTLIELLVVVIIIGILAAIAIPMYLNQRQKGWQANVKSDLRNAAVAQESYYTDWDEYSGDVNDLIGADNYGFNKSSNIVWEGTTGTTDGYCMSAHHLSDPDALTTQFHFNSEDGEPLEGGCAVAAP